MINTDTGEIIFANNAKLLPHMERANFIEVFQKQISRIDENSNGYSNYWLKPMGLLGEIFDVGLIFDQSDKLHIITMSFHASVEWSWNNWSEGAEIKLKIDHDYFLEQHLGKPPYEYDWGVISSSYDSRSASSGITIRYYKNDFGKEHVNKEDSILHKAWDGIKKGLTRSSDLY